MGIRGLTTFIENRSHLYLEDYELHDTHLVIDGNSIACQLYRWHCPNARDCFGGDYDTYARCVASFFQSLSRCRIVPIVVYDGGYEDRKLNTVLSRMRTKAEAAAGLNGSTEGSAKVFPLFLREAFEEVVRTSDVRAVRCDFEGDSDTARIAAALDCPVVSYDSDFFIFDVPYVPFNTLDVKARTDQDGESRVRCRVFRIEKFLKAYGGLDKSNLPLLAALLGNDYIKRAVFGMFYQNMKKHSDQQKRIKALMLWLANETKETALQKILGRYRRSSRKELKKKIWDAIKGYSLTDSKYLEYLGHRHQRQDTHMESEPTDQEMDEVSVDSEGEEVPSESESDSTFNEFKDFTPATLNPMFLDKYRRCRYPAYFMDMLTRHQYHCVQQVEDTSSPSSHRVSYRIISAIYKILSNNTKRKLLCFNRIQGSRVGKEPLENYKGQLPPFDRIEKMDQDHRRTVLLQVLEGTDGSMVEMFPPSWHLFLLALWYAVNRKVVTLATVYSMVLSKFTISYLDKKTASLFKKKRPRNNHEPSEVSTSLYSLENIDCSRSLNSLKNFFKMDSKLTERQTDFDRTVVHSVSQLQTVLLHSAHLNRLLDCPFEDLIISETLNCTFVYNFTVNLRRRNNFDDYVRLVLQDDEVFGVFETVMGAIKGAMGGQELPGENAPKKRRKKRRKKKLDEVTVGDEEVEETGEEVNPDRGGLFDPNNRFAVLGVD